MARLSFIKMQALGNDFVVLDDRGHSPSECVPLTSELARTLCDRRLGVGADQILWLKTPQDDRAQARMEVWNADGSTSEMCGNGLRAVAAFLHRRISPASTEFQIESAVGQHAVRVVSSQNSGALRVRIDMGPPRALSPQLESLEVDHRKFSFLRVSMGNPHAIFWVNPSEIPSLQTFPLEHWGPCIEHHAAFAPDRTNVEFVEALSEDHIRVRVWERGAGLTMACGSGACAAAVAAITLKKVKAKSLKVELPGGLLSIAWEGKTSDPVWMEGPAVEVFSGVMVL